MSPKMPDLTAKCTMTAITHVIMAVTCAILALTWFCQLSMCLWSQGEKIWRNCTKFMLFRNQFFWKNIKFFYRWKTNFLSNCQTLTTGQHFFTLLNRAWPWRISDLVFPRPALIQSINHKSQKRENSSWGVPKWLPFGKRLRALVWSLTIN